MNLEAIKETAIKLDGLFKKHATESEDVIAAYKQCKPVIEKAISGEIKEAKTVQLPSGYFSTEFDLFNIRELYKTAALLDMYLEGWESEAEYNAHMENIMKKSDQEYNDLLKKNT